MATHKRRKRTRPIEVRVLAKPETTPDGIIAGALLEVSDIYGDRAGTVVLPEVMAFIEKLEGFGQAASGSSNCTMGGACAAGFEPRLRKTPARRLYSERRPK